MERNQLSDKFPIGSKLPEFELPNVDGKTLGSAYLGGAKAGLVVFTCNHCPYVQGSEGMLIRIAMRYEKQGLKTLTISSNDPIKYPEDGFEKMKEKAKKLKLPYPYLFDETQGVAKLFDAACTPECYLFDKDGVLVFHGTINDNLKDPGAVGEDFISVAISQVLVGVKPTPAFVHPIGCSIKWK